MSLGKRIVSGIRCVLKKSIMSKRAVLAYKRELYVLSIILLIILKITSCILGLLMSLYKYGSKSTKLAII